MRELSGPTTFVPLRGGRTSLGVRQNRVSWFKGRIHSIRVSPRARPASIDLWPEGVPGAKSAGGPERVVDGRVSNVHAPSLIHVPPTALPNGTAVIMCPGGGYSRLAMANEAAGVAERLQQAGVTTFVLKYRLAEYGQPAPLQDVAARDPAVAITRRRIGDRSESDRRDGRLGRRARGRQRGDAVRRAGGKDRCAARSRERAAGLRRLALSRDHDGRAVRARRFTAQLAGGQAERRTGRTLFTGEAGPRRDAAGVPRAHGRRQERPAREQRAVLSRAAGAGVPAELHLYERGPARFRHTPGPRSDVRLGRALARLDADARIHRRRSPAIGRRALATGRRRRGRAASRDSARPTSATATTSIRSSPAISPIRPSSRTATTTT